MNIIEALYGVREERGEGIPLTDEERTQRHYKQYGTTDLPPRGTGLGQASDAVVKPFIRKDNPLLWVIIAGGGYLIWRMMQAGNRKRKRAEKSIRSIEENPLAFYDPEEKRAAEHPASPNPPGFCGIGSKPRLPNPDVNGFLITDTDTKTGYGLVWTFSLPRGRPADTGGTCIAASPWCSALCYGKVGRYAMLKGDPAVKKWYGRNYDIARKTVGDPDYFANRMLKALEILGRKKGHPKLMRVHVLGEFFHPDYVKAWIKVAQNARDWDFYAYTRTWVLAKKSSKWTAVLDELRHQPNFNLLLSTDPSTGPALLGWKECGVDVTYNRRGKICNHALDNNTTCYACGKCWRKTGPSVYIPVHGVSKGKLPIHEQMTAKRKEKYGFNPRGR